MNNDSIRFREYLNSNSTHKNRQTNYLKGKDMNYIYILLFLLVSCKSSATNLEELFPKTVEAKTELVDIKSEDIISPVVSILSIDNYLIIRSINQRYNIYVYDLERNRRAYELFTVGRASNEFLGTQSLAKRDNGLFIRTNTGEYVIVDSLYKGCDKNCHKIKGPSGLTRLIPMNDEHYIGIGLFEDSNKQFALFNKEFEAIEYFDDYPLEDDDKTALAYGFQGNLTYYGTDSFAYTSNVGNIIKFFSYKNGKIEKTNEYLFDMPSFKNVSTGIYTSVAIAKESKCGNLSVTASKNSYYLLNSEKTVVDRDFSSNTIYIFNTKGKPMEKMILDRKVDLIVYSEVYNCLFAVGSDENLEPAIYKIPLN